MTSSSFIATGPTEVIIELMFGPRQHDEHCRGWRWHLYMRNSHKGIEAAREEARKLIAERRPAPQKVCARYMQPGDIVGSGETVISVSAGVRTPRGKVEVTLEKDGERRLAFWGAHTTINVRRAA